VHPSILVTGFSVPQCVPPEKRMGTIQQGERASLNRLVTGRPTSQYISIILNEINARCPLPVSWFHDKHIVTFAKDVKKRAILFEIKT